MYHPVLFKYRELKKERFGAVPDSVSEHLEGVRKVLEKSFNDPIEIDGVNWWCMSDAINRHFNETRFSEETFGDVCENEDWYCSDETKDLRKTFSEIVKTVDVSHKRLEDWL